MKLLLFILAMSMSACGIEDLTPPGPPSSPVVVPTASPTSLVDDDILPIPEPSYTLEVPSPSPSPSASLYPIDPEEDDEDDCCCDE